MCIVQILSKVTNLLLYVFQIKIVNTHSCTEKKKLTENYTFSTQTKISEQNYQSNSIAIMFVSCLCVNMLAPFCQVNRYDILYISLDNHQFFLKKEDN